VNETKSVAISGYRDAMAKKRAVAEAVSAAGMALTINAPVHKINQGETAGLIDLALDLGAQRLEIAHVQYAGWAAENIDALMPDYELVLEEAALVAEAQQRLRGILIIDYVTPDHYARYPKPCMGGWGADVMIVAPDGTVLPCHGARTLPGLSFESVKAARLGHIWYESAAFQRFRGFEWMSEPCRSCERKAIDFGGCRCQAFAITGDASATDPACSLSPNHELMRLATTQHRGKPPRPRRMNYAPKP
jgi:pyrroloquinoline quinone biosynthesis protein E